MLDFESLSTGTPIPPVDANDLKRVWALVAGVARAGSEACGTTGWDEGLIADQCSQGADRLAVFFRAALVGPLLETGLLDCWRDGERPADVVFDALAAFPLPNGLEGFRPDEFANALRNAM